MSTFEIHERVFEFACRIVRLHSSLAKDGGAARTLGSQLLRAGTAVGSNLEEAKAAQSRADFVAKARISLKEAREAHYWLRLIEATELLASPRIHPLVEEANEIVAVLTTIVKKATTAPAPTNRRENPPVPSRLVS